jgi:hypothetical protein
MNAQPIAGITRRRSLRIVMRIPLLISSADASAPSEWEPVETIVVSLHGGMFRTRQKFVAGTKLDIRMRNRERSARGRVVWVSSDSNGRGYDLGFEILDQIGFWEINFPPDRWTKNPAHTRASS